MQRRFEGAISQDMLSCCDYSSFSRDGVGKLNGQNVRMDCEQLFLFGLSRFSFATVAHGSALRVAMGPKVYLYLNTS